MILKNCSETEWINRLNSIEKNIDYKLAVSKDIGWEEMAHTLNI